MRRARRFLNQERGWRATQPFELGRRRLWLGSRLLRPFPRLERRKRGGEADQIEFGGRKRREKRRRRKERTFNVSRSSVHVEADRSSGVLDRNLRHNDLPREQDPELTLGSSERPAVSDSDVRIESVRGSSSFDGSRSLLPSDESAPGRGSLDFDLVGVGGDRRDDSTSSGEESVIRFGEDVLGVFEESGVDHGGEEIRDVLSRG